MGEVLKDGTWAGFEVVHTYTRAQAISEGVLVDLSSSFPQDTTRIFKWNVACTDTVWTLIERAAEADGGADVAAYVYDVCFMAGMAIKTLRNADAPELFFKVMLPLRQSGTERQLKLVCGPVGFDDPTPCITIMLPEED